MWKHLYFILVILYTIHHVVSTNDRSRSLNPKLLLNRTCDGADDCQDDMSLCVENQCQCYFGYVPNLIDNKYYCRNKICSNNEECEYVFGQNVLCLERHCRCPVGYYYHDYNCITLHKPRGETCQQEEDNGPGTSCNPDRKIVCAIGCEPLNVISCETIKCYSNEICDKYHDKTRCSPDNNKCQCKYGYHEDPTNSFCVKGNRRDEPCSVSDECGASAVCAHGFCICKFGHQPSPNDPSNCERIFCHANKDCTLVDLNTQCNINANKSCECQKNNVLDLNTQSCTQVDETPTSFPLFAIILIIVLSLLLLLILGMLAYAKRFQLKNCFSK